MSYTVIIIIIIIFLFINKNWIKQRISFIHSKIKLYIINLIIKLIIYQLKTDSETVIKSIKEYIKSDSEIITTLISQYVKSDSENVVKLISQYFKPNSETKSEFKINSNNTSATITFEYYGKSYQIHVPYDKNLIRKMTGSKVILIDESGNKIDITQKPGIPYLVTPKQLGGTSIHIEKGENIKEINSDDIPIII